jgi:hypothetical protein
MVETVAINIAFCESARPSCSCTRLEGIGRSSSIDPPPFTLNFCGRWRWVINFTHRSPSEQEAGSVPESVWTLSRKVSYPDKNGTSICQSHSPGLGSKSRIHIVFSLHYKFIFEKCKILIKPFAEPRCSLWFWDWNGLKTNFLLDGG